MDNAKPIIILANAMTRGDTVSGADRIFIEFARRWQSHHRITIVTNTAGVQMLQAQQLEGVNLVVSPTHGLDRLGILPAYLIRTIWGIFSFSLSRHDQVLVYSSSDFWPDSIPAFFKKLIHPTALWIAGFYLFAPRPGQSDSPYRGKYWLTGLFYWLTQLPAYWLIRHFADMVFVTSDPDVQKFTTPRRGQNRVVVVRGGVDTQAAQEYLSRGVALAKKKYAACFVGRFHPQKGVLELVDIWQLVHRKKPDAKLAIIGVGVLEEELREKIAAAGLTDNIDLLGFRDGDAKYEIFKQSKIVVHPAIFDSGGMAACEAMAWGLPGVSFDLEALKTYYPQGMLKTPCFDLVQFAENVLRLLDDSELYARTRQAAIAWAMEWDWDKRAVVVLAQIRKELGGSEIIT